MVDMQGFAMWFLTEIPGFLMSPPISAFVGIAILLCIIKLLSSIIKIN